MQEGSVRTTQKNRATFIQVKLQEEIRARIRQQNDTISLIRALKVGGHGNRGSPNSPEATINVDNDFIDMSKKNILTAMHPSRVANKKIF